MNFLQQYFYLTRFDFLQYILKWRPEVFKCRIDFDHFWRLNWVSTFHIICSIKYLGKRRTTNNSHARNPDVGTWKKKSVFTLSAQQVPYSATVPGHLVRIGNGDVMLVKDSPSSLVVRSQILQKILRHAIYRDLMKHRHVKRAWAILNASV